MHGERVKGERTRVGILGAGFIAASHAAAYAANPHVELVGIADPVAAKAERLSSRHSCSVFASLDELVDAGIDAVSVCTPTVTHADLTVAALERGLSVLCEKPMARTIEEARRMIEAGRRSPGILMIGHVSRFEPEHARAAQLVAAGRIGDVVAVQQSITNGMPGWSEQQWLADLGASGGPLVDLAIHSFDYMSWIGGGEPVRVTAGHSSGGRYTQATVRFSSGMIGHVEASWAHPSADGFQLSTEIVGTEGRIHWTYDGLVSAVIHGTNGSVRLDPLGSRGFVDEIAAFVDAVRSGSPAPVSPESGLTALEIALAAERSANSGDVVHVRDEPEGWWRP